MKKIYLISFLILLMSSNVYAMLSSSNNSKEELDVKFYPPTRTLYTTKINNNSTSSFNKSIQNKINNSPDIEVGPQASIEKLTQQSKQDKYKKCFGSSIAPENYLDCHNLQARVKVPIWTLNSQNNKISDKLYLTVNKNIADEVVQIFMDIYNSPQKPVISIKDTGAFCYRKISGTDTLSQHSYGTCIDINSQVNPCYYYGGAINPYIGKTSYAFDETSDIVKIFKDYGWTWGAEWSNKTDFMHFSYLGG